MSKKLNIVYIDDDIIVADKPSGLLTIGDRYELNTPSLLSILRRKYNEVFTVHRLDRETSGLVVFARNKAAHKHLSLQFENRTVEKKYFAFVDGKLDIQGTIEEPLAESAFVKGKMVVHKKGKPSTTHFQLLNQYGSIAELDIQIETGRTHQIRVHMAHVGHPLFIDSIYGKRADFFLSELKGRKYTLSKDKVERAFLKRLTLHSYSLKINHPSSEEPLEFTIDLPKDLRALKYQLAKNSKNG